MYAGHQLLVGGVLHVDEAGHGVGEAVGLPVRHRAVFVGVDQTGVCQLDIQVDGAVDITLTVVADHDEVGVLQHTQLRKRVAHLADVAIQIGAAFVQIGAEHAVVVAGDVKRAGVHERDLRAELAQDVTGAGHDPAIHLRPLHEVLLAAQLPALTQQVGVTLHNADDLITAAGAAEAACQRVAGQRHPVLIDEVVHVGIAAGDRP